MERKGVYDNQTQGVSFNGYFGKGNGFHSNLDFGS